MALSALVDPKGDSEVPEPSKPGDSASARALTCFVIGPIGSRLAQHGSDERLAYEEAIAVLEEVIEPACKSVGLDPVRADSLARAGEITEQGFRRLRDDDVVIADLTGANANVMYELGLRHTEDKLTVQVGEFGRLPFDVNVIRTVQFSRSQTGLINARKELIKILEAGLNDDYDPVTATRVWSQRRSAGTPAGGDLEHGETLDASPQELAQKPSDDRGFVDILAEAEEYQEKLPGLLGAVGGRINALGELAESSAAEVARADAAGTGMRGRLKVVTKYAAGLHRIVESLEKDVAAYVQALASVSDGNIELIKRIEAEPKVLEDNTGGALDFAMSVRGLAVVTRDSLSSLASMVETTNENAKVSRVLRGPSGRLTAALDRFVEATSVIDEWDRRLQSLGVESPPEGWEPRFDGVDESVGNSNGDEKHSPDS